MSQINFEDDILDASDGVTKLLLAAEYWKEKATTLRAELDALNRQEPVAWTGAEQWEQLAYQLCIEDGHDEEDARDLLYEGGPIPEPWGERWQKYEYEAKRMIELVRKFTNPAPAQSVPVAAIEKVLAEVMEIAVSNGASSVSMPDEYVEIAAWLHDLAAAPKQEVK